MISRRHLFWLLLGGGLALPQDIAYAKDGGSGGENSGSGGDDGGNDQGDDGGHDPGEDDGDGEEDDQYRALDAVRNNHAASLKEILVIVRKQYEGEIVRVSLRGSRPNLIYHIKLLDKNDRLIEIQVDARSRKIVHTEGT